MKTIKACLLALTATSIVAQEECIPQALLDLVEKEYNELIDLAIKRFTGDADSVCDAIEEEMKRFEDGEWIFDQNFADLCEPMGCHLFVQHNTGVHYCCESETCL